MKRALSFMLLSLFLIAQKPENFPFQFILWEKNTEFKKSGASFSTIHEIIKINSLEGARKFSVLNLAYDPATTEVKFIHIRIKKKSGDIENINLQNLKDLPMPARLIFWNQRQKIINLKGLSPGDIIDFKYKTWGFKIAYLENIEEEREIIPPLRGHFYDVVYFSSFYPVKLKRYILKGPSDVQLSFEVFNGNLRVAKKVKGKYAYYTWEKRDIKPIKREPFMPSFSDIAEKLIVSSLHDWRVKSRWFFKVSEPSLKPDANLRELVRKLIKGTKNREKIIFILTHWVAQNIRYLGLWLGPEEGYTPNPAPFTLWARAGVCKDKAALLTSMLRVAGFPAFQVMTEAGSRVENIVADQFNHSVTAIKTESGFRLLDPTWAPDSRELWSSMEQLQDYLVGTPKGELLMRTPPFPAERNYLRIKLKGKIAGNTLTGVLIINTDNYYDTMFRRKINRSPKIKNNRVFYDLAYDISPFTRIKSIKRLNTFDFKKPLYVRIKFKAPYYLKTEYFFPPLTSFLPTEFNEFLKIEPFKSRRFPIRLRNTRDIKMEEEIAIPKDTIVVKIPERIEVKSKDAELKIVFWTSERKIEARYRLIIKNRLITDLKGFNKIKTALKKARTSFFIFKKGR